MNHEQKFVGNNFPTQHRHNVSTFQLPKGQVPAYRVQLLNLKTSIGRIADPVIAHFKNTYTNVLPIFQKKLLVEYWNVAYNVCCALNPILECANMICM